MPRRNFNATVDRTRRFTPTHVIIDTLNGNREVGSGTKANADAWAGVRNSHAGLFQYHVKPIHK